MGEKDTFEEVATIPIAFCTAIHVLANLARLQPGKSVLIQSATGAVGIAAMQIASHTGAEIYATVGNDDKKQALLDMGYGVKSGNIFSSRAKSTPDRILKATNGVGIDVIVCSAGGQMMYDTWQCIAMCGRSIEIGRTEVLEKGALALDGFSKNASFSSFDLEILSQTHPRIIGRVMKNIQELKIKGAIKPIPQTVYHISELDKALMTFSKARHIGKIVLSYSSNNNETIRYRGTPFQATFDPDAAYLLAGCLGGLGRSFGKWAAQRGARHLIYLSRSGAVTPEMQQFLDELGHLSVETTVIKGDVSFLKDVEAAAKSTSRVIKGVVHAALALNDAFFDHMTLSQFYATLKPHVIGALDLEKALATSPLDFFQIWSSFTVMFGTASQSNYLASNVFLDAFAHRRHSQGLPAASPALSQILDVGIVSKRPEYQRNVIRNGFYGNDEYEFLSFCEAGVLPPFAWPTSYDLAFDPNLRAHLLVGIGPAGLARHDSRYPISDLPWVHDPRFRNPVQASRNVVEEEAGGEGASNGGSSAEDTTADLSIDERIRLRVATFL
ncbi:MAG: hypothetical protein M1821_007728 [Bathelium mastoideum]|nr:MAG: hypothetical protein M1821_007728 [Bathelium mastoideum]